jgi:enterochelin esterase-like enzyme
MLHAVRAALTIGIATIALGVCDSPEARPGPRESRAPTETRTFEWSDTAVGEQRAVVVLPRERAADVRWPLLVALHGQGEARRGVRRGALGWVRDYSLQKADAALRRGRLTRQDFQGFVEPDRLRALNESLQARPYRGLVVACPYTNDLFADRGVIDPFDRFVVETLVPRLRRDLPVSPERAATGIDGVSLGGVQAMLVGYRHPETFGAVGGMQPAIRRYTADLMERVRRGGSARPAQRLRLVTSQGDHFRDVVTAFSRDLDQAGLAHDLLVTPGPHDYVWNRGPGSVEMLLWFDRALRGEAP